MKNIRSFNVDFNWYKGTYSPGNLFSAPNAAQLAKWYQELGCNNFWTFAVSYNGYAWYDSDLSPKIEGLKGNFTRDCVEEGHKRGMSVFAYHCLAANPVIEKKHPEWSRKDPDDLFNLIFCDSYIDWFCHSIQESIQKCGYDGLVIDWFRCPHHRLPKWEKVECDLYEQLMNEPFSQPVPAEKLAAFEKRCIERAWKKIKAAVVQAGNIPIWTNQPFEIPEDPVWNGNVLMKEADYILNESPDFSLLDWMIRESGPHTVIVQNLCGWEGHDLSSFSSEMLKKAGLFGFAAADPQTCLPYKASAGSDKVLIANQKNIEVIREIYHRLAAEK